MEVVLLLEEALLLLECLELSDLSLLVAGIAGTAGRALEGCCWGTSDSVLPVVVVTAKLDSGVPWGVKPLLGSILLV